MGLNARRAGLLVAKPTRPIEVPPLEGQSARARRRAAAAAELTAEPATDDGGPSPAVNP
jgi:hypothetical protein